MAPGRYLLEYEWAARAGVALDSCMMGVYMNNQAVKQHTPIEYHINNEKHLFNVAKGTIDDTEFTFCGEGKSDGLGAILKRVQVLSLD